MNNEIVLTGDSSAIVRMVLDGLTSRNSKRVYERALLDFMAWYEKQGRPGLSKHTVQRYRTHLTDLGLSPSTVNVRMSALRKLAREAADNELISDRVAEGVARVKGVKSAGVRMGNWLSLVQSQKMIDEPETFTLKGLRDRAILALMIGSGMRRSEVANLTFAHLTQRDGRWVVVDLVGKGNRVRTVPVPSWAKSAVDGWVTSAEIGPDFGDLDSSRVFRSVTKGDRVRGNSMSSQAIFDVVKLYADRIGLDVSAHDLRRTFAKLAHKAGAGLDQIQLTLGHQSIRTTEIYLGVEQDLQDAPCDRIRLKV